MMQMWLDCMSHIKLIHFVLWAIDGVEHIFPALPNAFDICNCSIKESECKPDLVISRHSAHRRSVSIENRFVATKKHFGPILRRHAHNLRTRIVMYAICEAKRNSQRNRNRMRDFERNWIKPIVCIKWSMNSSNSWTKSDMNSSKWPKWSMHSANLPIECPICAFANEFATTKKKWCTWANETNNGSSGNDIIPILAQSIYNMPKAMDTHSCSRSDNYGNK